MWLGPAVAPAAVSSTQAETTRGPVNAASLTGPQRRGAAKPPGCPQPCLSENVTK